MCESVLQSPYDGLQQTSGTRFYNEQKYSICSRYSLRVPKSGINKGSLTSLTHDHLEHPSEIRVLHWRTLFHPCFVVSSNRLYRMLRSLLKQHFTCSLTSFTELVRRKRIRKTNFHNFLRFSSYGFIFRGITVIGTSKGTGILNEFNRQVHRVCGQTGPPRLVGLQSDFICLTLSLCYSQ